MQSSSINANGSNSGRNTMGASQATTVNQHDFHNNQKKVKTCRIGSSSNPRVNRYHANQSANLIGANGGNHMILGGIENTVAQNTLCASDSTFNEGSNGKVTKSSSHVHMMGKASMSNSLAVKSSHSSYTMRRQKLSTNENFNMPGNQSMNVGAASTHAGILNE